MVLTTYTANTALTNTSYLPPDQTPYTATSATGERFNVFYPDNDPTFYPQMYGPGTTKTTPWIPLVVENLSGDSPNGTTSSAPSTSITSATGIPYQWLRNGGAVVSVQKTSCAAANTGVTGLGFVHLPGGIDGYYESRNRPNCLKDSIFIIQHLRFNARSYAYEDNRSYKLSSWIGQYGNNSGFGQPWCASAPSRACELGNGGPYEESTVPNFVIAQAFYPYYWFLFDFNEANTGCFFPQFETGGTGKDDVVAASIGSAPRRYVLGMGAQALISDPGQPCHPKMFCFTNTGPEDLNFGEPFIEGRRKFNTGVHDGKHMLCLKQALPPGTVELRLAPGAAYTLGSSQVTSTAIPGAYYDGNLNVAPAAKTAATALITLTAAPATNDLLTVSDGVTSITYQWTTGAASGSNVAISNNGSAANCMTRLQNLGIALSGLQLTFTLDTPSATSVLFTSSNPNIAANATWSCTGAATVVGGLASWGTITLAGSQPSDGDTLTLNDGIRSVVFEYDSGGASTAGRVRVTIGGTTTVTMTNLKNAILASGIGLSFNNAATASTGVTLTIDSRGILAATPTWTQTGTAHTFVQPNGGGTSSSQSLTSEAESSGAAITAMLRAAKAGIPRWDETLPPAGIRRSYQVAGARVAATGNITFTSATNPADTETITLNDGVQSVIFEFDAGNSGTGLITAGNVGVQIGTTAAATMTNLLAAIAASGLRLTWVTSIPSTTSIDFTSTLLDGDPNQTWTETMGSGTVTGLSGGTQSRPRCIVPPANGNGRTGVKLVCTSLSGDSDLMWGTRIDDCRNRLRAGEEKWIAGTGKVWACSAGGGSQVAKYMARECDARSK